MQEFLVFRLYGPMISWGDIAVGEVRRSTLHPSRSAVLGLVSAAIGIKREEFKKLRVLFDGYDMAVKVISVGTSFVDFHTVSVPSGKMPGYIATRRDEIAFFCEQSRSHAKTSRPNPVLSYREYRCDALSIIALRPRITAPYSLHEIQAKLIRPEYVLYLGRKSCPLSLPLKPQILTTEGFKAALDNAQFPPIVSTHDGSDISNRYIAEIPVRYYWENEAGDMTPQQTHERYDEPISRTRWQFAPRKEYLMTEGGGK
jgi:CRISPR system Cascade subunit CasD